MPMGLPWGEKSPQEVEEDYFILYLTSNWFLGPTLTHTTQPFRRWNFLGFVGTRKTQELRERLFATTADGLSTADGVGVTVVGNLCVNCSKVSLGYKSVQVSQNLYGTGTV